MEQQQQLSLFAIPLMGYLDTGDKCAIIGATQNADGINYLCVSAQGNGIAQERWASNVRFSRTEQRPHDFRLVPAIRLPIAQLDMRE